MDGRAPQRAVRYKARMGVGDIKCLRRSPARALRGCFARVGGIGRGGSPLSDTVSSLDRITASLRAFQSGVWVGVRHTEIVAPALNAQAGAN